MKLLDDSFLTLKLYIVLAVVGAVYAALRRLIRNRISDNWILLQGTVESSGVRIQYEGETTAYIAEITYSYSCEGEFYGGQYHKRYISEAAADEFVAHYPVKAAITIRCKPAHPETSMLREDDNAAHMSAASSHR